MVKICDITQIFIVSTSYIILTKFASSTKNTSCFNIGNQDKPEFF